MLDHSLLTEIDKIEEESTYSWLNSHFRDDKIINLACNENPLGTSQNVMSATYDAKESLNRYPFMCNDLKRAISENISPNLSEGNIILANGSSEVIQIISRCFLREGDEVIVSQPTWAFYGNVSEQQGARIVDVSNCDQKCNLDEIVRNITSSTKLVFVCNPNSPTGVMVADDEVRDFLERIPSYVVVVLDEAYRDFAEIADIQALTGLIYRHKVVLTRTFSKIYGLAGLRIGYGVSDLKTIAALHLYRLPYSNNTISLAAALAALGDRVFFEKTRSYIIKERSRLTQAIRDMGFEIPSSETNFLFIDSPDRALEIRNTLLETGVWVRHIRKVGVRISIGSQRENDRLLQGLSKLVLS